MPRVSNERKNLTRLAGEFLVASRLTQRGYMVSLQWGTTIGYDILVFDKDGNVAFVEVKTSASYDGRWLLQKKYANPGNERIPLKRRFICCVNMARSEDEPQVYVFPCSFVSKGLHYFYPNGFSASPSYEFSLPKKPRGMSRDKAVKTVGEYIRADKYLEGYAALGVTAVEK